MDYFTLVILGIGLIFDTLMVLWLHWKVTDQAWEIQQLQNAHINSIPECHQNAQEDPGAGEKN